MVPVIQILASFTTPMRINTDPVSMLWLIPLVASIAIVYKATKVHRIKPIPFARESVVLFGSIMVFVIVAGLVLYGIAWLVTERLPGVLNSSSF
jgi:hypothetical protein